MSRRLRRLALDRLITLCLLGMPAIGLADSQRWSEPLTLSGEKQPITISPYHAVTSSVTASNDKTLQLYNIDYSDLTHQLKVYRDVYYTGQVLHGVVLIKAKPRFIRE